MKYLRPLLSTFLFFAVLHVIVLVFMILLTGDISYLNVFHIVGLTYFFPDIDKGNFSQILSTLIIIIVYLFFYFKRPKK